MVTTKSSTDLQPATDFRLSGSSFLSCVIILKPSLSIYGNLERNMANIDQQPLGKRQTKD